jgi:gluconate 5-dehydrogenase
VTAPLVPARPAFAADGTPYSAAYDDVYHAAEGGAAQAQHVMRGRGASAYCSSKGGLVMLIRQHAAELGRRGICVNGIAPTVVRTKMGAHWLKNPKTRAWLKERIPLGRVAEPADCVGAALFFCSPASDFVTGQILYLDGGITASQ